MSHKPSRQDILSTPIQQIDLENITSIKDLVESFKHSSIQSRNIGRCAEVYENMLTDQDRPTIIIGLSGALIAGGLRKVIRDMVKFGIVDCIVSTGAVLYQDFYQARGFKHYMGAPDADDGILREHFIDRIYDTYVDEEKFRETDMHIGELASKLEPRAYSTREFLKILGEGVKEDDNSILATAAKWDIPVFCPALNDSSIGIGLTQFYRQNRDGKGFSLDLIRDNYEITSIKVKSKKSGAIYIGGGIPKNYINDCVVIAEMMGHDPGGHHYAFQLTADAPHWGGLSGSTLEEAQSWGKVHRKATKATAYVEATVGLPLIVGYILQKEIWKGRPRLKYIWKGDELRDIQQE